MSIKDLEHEIDMIRFKIAFCNLTGLEITELSIALIELQATLIKVLKSATQPAPLKTCVYSDAQKHVLRGSFRKVESA